MNVNVLKRGMNLHSGDYTLKDDLVTNKYFEIIAKAGFDHVRLPVRGKYLREGGSSFFGEMLEVCNRALRHGLIPIFDMHGYYDINENPAEEKLGYIALWAEIAEYMKGCDERIIFELLNEPADACGFKVLNEIQNECIETVRKHHPTRLLAAATAHMNTLDNLHFLLLPENDENIFVTIHDYTPMKFTYQGADWPGTEEFRETGIKWNDKAEKEYLEARFAMMAAWSRWRNRSIHLGEFGVFFRADMTERANWISFMARMCETHGFSWAYWEFWQGFGAFDREKGDWHQAVLKALIPE